MIAREMRAARLEAASDSSSPQGITGYRESGKTLRSRAMVKTTIVVALGAVLISLPGSAQQLRGRVVAEATRAPLEDATVSLLLDGDSSVVARVASGSDGFFTLMMPGPGSYLIDVELLGYASTTRPITIVGADSMTVPAFVVTESAIRLDSIVANVRPDSVGLEVGFSHAAHLVAGARLALLERQGMRMAAVLRQFSICHPWKRASSMECRPQCVWSHRDMDARKGATQVRRADRWRLRPACWEAGSRLIS
jgi:hypothetical protein